MAWIEMDSVESATNAIAAIHNTSLYTLVSSWHLANAQPGKLLRVSYATYGNKYAVWFNKQHPTKIKRTTTASCVHFNAFERLHFHQRRPFKILLLRVGPPQLRPERGGKSRLR